MDNSPTALFENYDEDLKAALASIGSKLETARSLKGEPRKSALKKVADELDEAEETVAQMEVEIPSMPVSIRRTFQDRLSVSKAQVEKARKSYRDAMAEAARAELLSGPGGRSSFDDPYGDDDTAFNTRTRLLAGTEALNDSSRRLDNAHRIALETEDVGADILRSLRGQREQIEHTRDTLTRADGSIDRASGTLKKMIYKMYQQKVVTGAIIAVLVLLILLVLYSKLF